MAWIADVALSIPTIVFLLLVASIYRGNLKAAMITLGCLFAPGMMRVTRAATLGVRNELYITAARVSGLSHAAIITRHVLKRILGPIIVQLSIAGGVALGVQSGLAFIGLGVKPPSPSWGFDLADATTLISENRWPLVPPAAVIGLSIMCFGLLGDAIRDSAAERWSTPTRKVPRGGRRHLIAAPFADGLPPGPQALLSVRGLTIAFDSPGGDILAVEGVSFDAHAGETLGIVGESGCGKTISVLGVMGVLPGSGRIVRGSVRLAGRELVGLDNESLRRLRGSEIAYISQEPMVALNPAFRVGQLLSAAIRIHHGVSRTEAGRRALSLLADVRLPEPEIVAKRYPHELSGGMAQRVAIALALSGEPKVLIADEPTTALDVTVQAEILDLLRNLQAQRGMAIVLVTHDWGVVCDLAATAVVMYAGEVAEQASIRELVRDPKHPYTAGLLESDPHRVTTDILPTIPGVVPPPGHWPIGCHFAARCTYATPECSAAPIPLVHLVGGREVRCLHFDEVGLGKNAAHV